MYRNQMPEPWLSVICLHNEWQGDAAWKCWNHTLPKKSPGVVKYYVWGIFFFFIPYGDK